MKCHPVRNYLKPLLLGLALTLPAATVLAQAPVASPCRIAFDMGSSGIRVGASTSERSAKAEIDALGPLWAGKGIGDILPATIAALRELPQRAGLDAGCSKVGGGFSAWRLALQQDAAGLAGALARIRDETGVAVLVMPPRQEGAYGFFAAQQKLGQKFATSHVLDIGGGSLQVSGEKQSFADALGQKSWHRLLCQHLRRSDEVPCALQPMDERDLTRARALLAVRLTDSGLSPTTTLTAISRPVSRGVLPAVRRIGGGKEDTGPLLRHEITATIAAIAPLAASVTAERAGTSAAHAAFLLSDLLLVEGLLRLSADGRLQVAETALDNLPGLLADERAFAWQARYDCYLQRLPDLGTAAYDSDPATCRAEPATPR